AGSLGKPIPAVVFPWGSQSIRRVRCSDRAKEADKLMAVVVLPTPPFWFATAITRLNSAPSGCEIYHIKRKICKLFHVEQYCRTAPQGEFWELRKISISTRQRSR